jgi:outer membrane protein assembly factor BamB
MQRLSRAAQWIVAALAVGGALAWPTGGTARGEDWPRWRGVRGDGTWQPPAELAVWSEEGPQRLWRAEVGPGYSGICVAEGKVYTMDRPPGSEDERVVCFDAATGRLVWEHRYHAVYGNLDYGKGPRSTPTFAAGRLYTLGAVGHLHCLDAATGRVLWAKDLVAEEHAVIPQWGLAASPLVDGQQVIVHAGLPGGCYAALDAQTGQWRWRSGDDPAGYATPIVIEHAGVRQLVGWTPEHVVGLRIDDGQPLWQVPYKVTYGVSIASPVFHQGIVLVCGYWEGSKAIALGPRPQDAHLLWEENRYLRGLMDPPLVRDGYGYLLDKQHGVVAFELASGEKQWTDGNRLTPRDRNPQLSLVWLGDSDRAIGLNSEGELLLVRLTPQGFQELCRSKIVGRTWAHPAYAGRVAYARDDQQLVAVALTPPAASRGGR